ncbi:MAG: flagellar hook-basal body complex protein FliE [Rhodobacter sp.]|uniref:flagellar hook-basal body complex protein FliE n=1 Tax=Pararhodobacter sp. TaxID=2127056 RepID=UPI001D631348|nr:flagellar hook-basal body complex protein FliE [Pararhodobacter sp.]MCB1346600.1 flagellar hook-basal body complex protein FliE [Paracoccaceae bacterium]MCC0072835.1 flagellar hook-basal body complex protein FliE [Rhodobacter sp.]HPD90943.1 flagellar hook-basal body complex protein FliE [Pararhodobacter sp.]
MDIAASLAARSYGAARPLTSPEPDVAGGPGASLSQAAQSFAQVLDRADTTAQQAMAGNADPHALVASLSEAQMAVETAVAVRDKVVEAYLEILRMPV